MDRVTFVSFAVQRTQSIVRCLLRRTTSAGEPLCLFGKPLHVSTTGIWFQSSSSVWFHQGRTEVLIRKECSQRRSMMMMTLPSRTLPLSIVACFPIHHFFNAPPPRTSDFIHSSPKFGVHPRCFLHRAWSCHRSSHTF